MSNIKVIHLVGGQVVIGALIREQPILVLEAPHEVFATPSPNELRASITFIPFGTLFGLVPELTPAVLQISGSNVLAVVEPPPEFLDAYRKSVTRKPEEAAQIAASLQNSASDITRGGTL